MWNRVASETREAQVYLRLLDKIEEQRRAYQGQVFDVLGAALPATELRRLLIDAAAVHLLVLHRRVPPTRRGPS